MRSPTPASRAIALSLALIALAGCSASAGAKPNWTHAVQHPAAILEFDGPIAGGSHGAILGFFRNQTQYTYVADFEVSDLQPPQHGLCTLPRAARGTRRIYFHAAGARTSFADRTSFIGGDPIALEQVMIAFAFDRGAHQAMVRMTPRTGSAATLQIDGAAPALPEGIGKSASFFGRPSPQYGGYLLIDAADIAVR